MLIRICGDESEDSFEPAMSPSPSESLGAGALTSLSMYTRRSGSFSSAFPGGGSRRVARFVRAGFPLPAVFLRRVPDIGVCVRAALS